MNDRIIVAGLCKCVSMFQCFPHMFGDEEVCVYVCVCVCVCLSLLTVVTQAWVGGAQAHEITLVHSHVSRKWSARIIVLLFVYARACACV